MITEVTFSDFLDAFNGTYKNNFSYEGLRALYEHLLSHEENTGETIRLDVVALCCEYTEHKTAMDGAQSFNYEEVVDLEPYGSLDLIEVAELEEKQSLEWLKDRTQVIEFNGGIIIQNF